MTSGEIFGNFSTTFQPIVIFGGPRTRNPDTLVGFRSSQYAQTRVLDTFAPSS